VTSVEVSAGPGSLDLAIYRGDTWTEQWDFADNDGPIPLPGTWRAQIRHAANSPTTLASMTLTVDAEAGTITATLDADTTAGLMQSHAVWDLEQTDDGTVRTWLAGNVAIRSDVTRD